MKKSAFFLYLICLFTFYSTYSQELISYPIKVSTLKNSSVSFRLTASEISSSLNFNINTSPSHGSVVISDDQITYTPESNFVGEDSFSFSSTNGSTTSNAATVTLQVLNNYLDTQKPYQSTLDGSGTSDAFGSAISLSNDATTLAVGSNIGTVGIYKDNESDWELLGSKLIGDAADGFGKELALSGNGSLLAIGVPYLDIKGKNKRTDAGTVKTYQYESGSWNSISGIPTGNNSNDHLGATLAINHDGTYIVVGTPGDDTMGVNSGKVDVYHLLGGQWEPIGVSVFGDGDEDGIGLDVAINASGTIIAVGSPSCDHHGTNTGHVKILQFNGTSWNLLGEAIEGTVVGEQFGNQVSLSSDGYRIAVGSPEANNIKVYDYIDGSWSQVGSTLSGDANGDQFGSSLQLSMAGRYLVVGAPNGSTSGEVKLYTESNNEWTQVGSTMSNDSNLSRFGEAVALSCSGDRIIVSAPSNLSGAGSVYTYKPFNVYHPIANSISAVTDEDTELSIELPVSDGDGDSLSISTVSNPENHSVTYSGTTAIVIPAANFNGSSGFSYKVNDGSVDSATATVSIAVNSVNDIPIVNGETLEFIQDQTITVSLFAIDHDSSIESYEIVTYPTIGELTLNDSNKVSYTPQSGFTGTVSFTYRAYDGIDYSDPAIINLVFNSADQYIPTPIDISIATPINTTISNVPLIAKNSNFSSISYSIASNPNHGTVNINDDGTATYIPSNGYVGSDSFTFKAKFQTYESEAGTVSIDVFNEYKTTAKQIYSSIEGSGPGDVYGSSLSIAQTGNRFIVGAPLDDDFKNNAGLAQIIKNSTSAWIQEGSSLVGSTNVNDQSGTSVAMSADGKTVVIASKYIDKNTGQFTVYHYNGSSWIQKGDPINGQSTADEFGASVAVSALGDMIIVGSPKNDLGGEDAGLTKVYKFDAESSQWVLCGGTKTGGSGDLLGSVVAVDYTGGIYAAGVPLEDSKGEDAGAVQLYKHNGVNWTSYGTLYGDTAGDQFGTSIALDAKGLQLIVGSPYADSSGLTDNGSVKIFKYIDSTWVQQGSTIYGTNSGDHLGQSVSMSAEGSVISIGVPGSDHIASNAGALMMYHYNGSSWDQIGTTQYGQAAEDHFGQSVAMSADQSVILSAAPNSDGKAGVDTGQVIAYRIKNYTPITSSASYTINEDEEITIQLSAVDADGDDLTYSVVSNPDNATITISGTTAIYIPHKNFNGATSFSFKVNDGTVDSNVSSITITINPINDAPRVPSGTIDGIEGTPIIGNFVAVDPEGDDYTFGIISMPTHGTLVFTSPTSGIYTPEEGFTGLDYIVYYATDGESQSATATLTLNIEPKSYFIPEALDVYASTKRNTPIEHIELLARNKYFLDISYTIVSQPEHGLVSINSGSSASYSPTTEDFEGIDTFTYKASYEGFESELATGYIKVFRSYRATKKNILDTLKGEKTLDQMGSSVSVSGDGSSISVGHVNHNNNHNDLSKASLYTLNDTSWKSSKTIITESPAKGDHTGFKVKLSADGKTVAVSSPDFKIDTKKYGKVVAYEFKNNEWSIKGDPIISHMILCGFGHDIDMDASGSIIIIGIPKCDTFGVDAGRAAIYRFENDQWTPMGDEIYGTNEHDELGTSVSMNGVGNIIAVGSPKASINGQDSGAVSVFKYNGVQWNRIGDVLLGTNSGDEFGYDVALDDSGKRLIIGMPNHDGNGVKETGGVRVYDYIDGNWVQKGSDIYGTLSDYNEGYSVDISANGKYIVSGIPKSDTASVNAGQFNQYILSNDEWILSNEAILGDTEKGELGYSLALSSDNTIVVAGAPYVANSSLEDGTKAGEVHAFSLVNFTPESSSASATLNEDESITLTLHGSDLNKDELTYTIVGEPSHGSVSLTGSTAVYTPEENYNGIDSFTFKVSDDEYDSNISAINLTINPINDAPESKAVSTTLLEDQSKEFSLIGSDVDGDEFSAVIVTEPTHGSISLSGLTVTYTPDENYNGPDQFTYKVSDNLLESNISDVIIAVEPVNDAPTSEPISSTIANHMEKVIALSALDVDEDDLIYSLVSEPSHGSVVINGANLTYSPDTNFAGTDVFTYRAYDGESYSNTSSITLTIYSTNEAPISTSTTVSVDEHNEVIIQLPATDPEGYELTYHIIDTPINGTISQTGSTVVYQPIDHFFGQDSFTFKTNDGELDSNIATVSITVNEVYKKPTAESYVKTIDEDTSLSITLEATSDHDTPISYSIVSNPENGTISLVNNVAVYTPNDNYFGADEFTYIVNDGTSDSNTATVSINVTAVNDAPHAIYLTNRSLYENNRADALIAVMTGFDIDEGDAQTLSLSPIEGAIDNDYFRISENKLYSTQSFDYEERTYYTIGIKTTDQGGLYYEELITIEINDINEYIETVISFDNLTKTYGEEPFELNALSTSDAPISYESSDNSIASINGDLVTINNAGEVVITASQEANEVYSSATKSMTLTIVKATPSLTVADLNKSYSNDASFELNTISDSDGVITYRSENTDVIEIIGSQAYIKGAGTAEVIVNQKESSNYTSTSTNFKITVSKSTPELSFDNVDKTYGDAPFRLNATSNSNGKLTYLSTNPEIATVDDATLTIVNSGMVRIDVIQEATDNFEGVTTSMILTVAKKTLNVSGITAANKIYDGTVSATIDSSSVVYDGLVVGDSIELTTTASFETKKVGTDKTILLTNTYSSTKLSNYIIVDQEQTTATIYKRSVSLQATSGITKEYDGTTLMPLGTSGLDELSGVLDDDSVYLIGTPQFNTKDVGEKTIVQGTVTMTGADALNYELNWTDGSGSITEKTLTIVAKNAAKFVSLNDPEEYKGAVYYGFVNGETEENLNGSLVVERTNSEEAVGTYTGVLKASGYSSTNYDIIYLNGDFTIVPPDQLVIEIEPTSSVEYSETPTYTITGSYLSSVTSQVVVLSNAVYDPETEMYTISNATESATFAITAANIIGSNGKFKRPLSRSGNINVGSYGLDVVNTLINSDVISDEVVPLGSLTVIPKPISARTTTTPSKDYDGAMLLPSVGIQLDGVVTGDLVSSVYTGYFNDVNAGSNKSYSIESIRLTGDDSGAYTLTETSLTNSNGVINKVDLIVSGNELSKVYDGKVNSKFSASYNGFVSGEDKDNLTGELVTSGAATTAINAGTYSYDLEGYQSQNYNITYHAGAVTITKAPIEISGINVVDKVYDGTTNAIVNAKYIMIGNLVDGDDVVLNTSTANFETADVGEAKLVSLNNTYKGASLNNYTITDQTYTTAAIIKAPLTVSVNDTSTTYLGTAYQNFSVSYSGFVNGEDASVLGGTLLFSGAGANAINSGTYDVSAQGLVSHNYEITFEPGIISIYDTDTDQDGINDSEDNDIDGDDIINSCDADINGDGTIDNGIDTDGDGINNSCDTDDDNDGWSDVDEFTCGSDPLNDMSILSDNDQDGIADCIDTDDDNDGILDEDDVNPYSSYESIDTDGDGIGNNTDTDDDNDGQLDAYEIACGSNPLDPTSTSVDTDNDSIPDCIDNDDDNDSILDLNDSFPLDADEEIDTDGDGIGNNDDLDDDNDGFSDVDEETCGTDPLRIESQPGDYDNDGIADCIDEDMDGDGVANSLDAFPMNPFETADNDGDGIGDIIDADDDNDGVLDANDAYPYDADRSTDNDMDGVSDSIDNDVDGDGFDDAEIKVSGALTPNQIGVESTWKITNLKLHPYNRVSVYDKNGVEVYHTENYKNDWRGTFKDNGELLPGGSYFYKVYLYDTKQTLSGWLLIMY